MTLAQLKQWWTFLTPPVRARVQLNTAGQVPDDIVAEVLEAVRLSGGTWPVTIPGPTGLHLPNDVQSWIAAGGWQQ